jgi:hypothetical protein
MKVYLILFLLLISSDLWSFEIVEKKFKNSIDFNYSQVSGGSFYDINGKNQTELIRFVDTIRYANNRLSPINYVFRRVDQIYNLNFKYFVIEGLALKAGLSSSSMKLEQREFFYFGFTEFFNDKVDYNLDTKNQFVINNMMFGTEYYFTKEKLISNVNIAYFRTGIEEDVRFISSDTIDPSRKQTFRSVLDSTQIVGGQFEFAEPNVISLGFLLGYRFEQFYLEFANNTLLRSGDFRNLNISHLAFEMTANEKFKLRTKIVYDRVLNSDGKRFDNDIPFRPFRANPQQESIFINAGIAFLQEKYMIDFNYSQVLIGFNILNWGGINLTFSYFLN